MMRHMACPERERVAQASNGERCIDDRSGIFAESRRTSHRLSGIFSNDANSIFYSEYYITNYGQLNDTAPCLMR
jgi:hypothetical protein